jgi:fructose-1,6-bisphosphatase/inositol monophosphatase family enzyme
MLPVTTKIKHCLQNCRNPDRHDMLLAAAEAALKAGTLLQELFEQPHQIRHKSAIDLVTEADLAAEELILEILHHKSPGTKILSEESLATYDAIPDEPVWIVDPLDGTTNFAHNFPWFAVSIALYAEGSSQVGVIYNPIQQELFCATLAGGAWLNDAPLGTRRPATPLNRGIAMVDYKRLPAELAQCFVVFCSGVDCPDDLCRRCFVQGTARLRLEPGQNSPDLTRPPSTSARETAK